MSEEYSRRKFNGGFEQDWGASSGSIEQDWGASAEKRRAAGRRAEMEGRANEEYENAIEEAFRRQLERVSILGGLIVDVTFGGAGGLTRVVLHGLNRQPQGFIIVGMNAAGAAIHEDTTGRSPTLMTLVSSGPAIAKVWIW